MINMKELSQDIHHTMESFDNISGFNTTLSLLKQLIFDLAICREEVPSQIRRQLNDISDFINQVDRKPEMFQTLTKERFRIMKQNIFFTITQVY